MEALVADRSERGKLRFSGEQRAWFLHQILTQDFEDIAPGEARDTAMLTPHGRMVAFAECVGTADAILMHFEPSLRPGFGDALQRYVFATRVAIDDVTDEMGLVLVVDEAWEAVGKEIAPDALAHPTRSLGAPAGYLWMPRAAVEPALAAAARSGARPADEAELEEIRIANGAPRWGFEMDGKTFPQEVGIDATAVHFSKGCYLGQEAMAKIQFRGKVNRRLARVSAAGALIPGAELTADGAPVGRVTSAGGTAGLAIVKRDVAPGTRLATEAGVVEVLD